MTYRAVGIGALGLNGMSGFHGVGDIYDTERRPGLVRPKPLTADQQLDRAEDKLDASTEELESKKKLVKFAAIGFGALVITAGVMIAKRK